MKAVYITEIGGSDKLQVGDIDTPQPAEGQVLVRIAASGVNFIDTYHRTGLYTIALPAVLGVEGAGVVEAAGPGAAEWLPGTRVAYCMERGSYAEFAVVPASKLVRLPESMPFELAAACLLQGMTAHYLTHSTFPLKPGQTVLLHAAAGGTGLLILQMAKRLGARVIGTASTAEKLATARQAGADELINYREQQFEQEVKRLTGGQGVDVVYDSVGAATFEGSLNCLRTRGTMVSFGNASGPVAPIPPLVLSQKGSLFLTRPNLANYTTTRDELLWRAGDVLNWVASSEVKIHIGRRYPLAAAKEAHDDLESRATTGKLVLTIQP